MPRSLFIVLFFIISPLWLIAAHLKGGYIEYEYLGPTPSRPGFSKFKITVYQYLDCNSAGGQIDEDITIGIFNAVTNVFSSSISIPKTNTNIIQKQSFVCIDNPPVVCYRIDSYSTTQDLQNNPDGYILSVQRCCRIPGINNVFNSSNTGVTYTVKLYPNISRNGFIVNSSPIFSQEDTALVCARNGFTFPFKASDPDEDSLVYRFTSGLNTPSREAKPDPPLNPPFPNLTYVSGYNAGQPLGSSVTINPNTGIISGIAPDKAGDYVVAVAIDEYRRGVKISETRKELHLAVGNCNIPRAVLPDNITNCKDFTILFENQSMGSGINSYFWDFGVAGSNTDTSSLPRPSFTYPDTGVYRAKLVVNPGGFCPDSMATDVRIFPGFTVDFDQKGICSQLPYQFTDASKTTYGVIKDYRWNFGDSTGIDTSNTKNPVYSFKTANTYQVTLVASTSKGCVDSATKPVVVSDKPSINLAFRDTLICVSDNVQLLANGAGNYSWSPNINMINPNSASPVVSPKTDITYIVDLNNNSCIAKDSVRVRVVSFITISAGNDTTICRGDPTQLNTITQGTKFQWSPVTGLDNSTIKNPVATVTSPSATYAVIANLGSCQAIDSIKILTQPYPVLNAGNDTAICFGQPVTLRGSSNAAILRWQPANQVQNPGSAITKATPPGTQAFILTGNFTTGCIKPATDTVLITVIPRIEVFAGNDTALVAGQSLTLNAAANATSFSWSPPTGLTNTAILKPELFISPDMATGSQYLRYTLTATVTQGCSATDDILIRVFKLPSIYVPTGFTPNSDGLNDVIRPVLAGIKQYDYFRVYNRYGQLIFETKSPGAGWNGTINGQPQATGGYVYDCRGTDFTGKKIQVKGNFVLIR